uniref:Calcipressin-like protein n=1 Tax=Hanseniaspora osmophila TaxID=56408 RepID=A0A1E5R1J0_9ASCO
MNVTDTIVVTWSGITPGSQIKPADVAAATFDYISKTLAQIQGIRAKDVQIIPLRSMQRVLVVCPSRSISSLLRMYLKTFMEDNFPFHEIHLSFSFSLKDTNGNLNHVLNLGSEAERNLPGSTHLTVPEHTKLFLVSPPQSPTSEFDFGKVEDSPNKDPHPHIPLDFADSKLVQRSESTEEQDNDFVRYVHQDKELLSTDLPTDLSTQNTPNIHHAETPVRIVLTRELKQFKDGTVEPTHSYDTSKNKIAEALQRLHANTATNQYTLSNNGIAKTAAPPRSIFEDDEDLICYSGDD